MVELTRAKCNFSIDTEYAQQADQICQRLKDRGYPEWTLTRTQNIVRNKSRPNLLTSSPCKESSGEQPILVLEYNNQYHAIKSIIEKYIPILLEDETMEEILHGGFRVVSKKSQTLGNILSPS